MLYDGDGNDRSSISANEGELSKKDLEEFAMLVTEGAKFRAETHMFNEMCWDLCVQNPGTKLDTKTSTCMSNCVNRFIDASAYIANRYINRLQRGAARM